MLEEFISFAESVLPAIPIDTKDNIKEAISQFKKDGQTVKCLTNFQLDELSQGDILSDIRFSYFDSDGVEKYFVSDAMVLTTSCNIDRKRTLVMSPYFPIETYKGNQITELKNNAVYNYMYIPDFQYGNGYVDFGYISTYNANLIVKAMEQNKIKRIASLNLFGYYFFVVKFSIYLLRTEDSETLEKRRTETCFS